MATESNSQVLRTIPLLIAVCFVSLPAQAQYSGGGGTAEDPYRIATAEDLMLLGESPEDYDKHFILTDDIDLSGHTLATAPIAPDSEPNDYHFGGTAFTGVFDGAGHRITSLTINGAGTSNEYLGLFGCIKGGGQVNSLRVEMATINSGVRARYVGGLAGASDEGIIVNCHVTGDVIGLDGSSAIGGLVGKNGDWFHGESVIAKCSTACNVSGGDGCRCVGGLVGWNQGSPIMDCCATGSVTGGAGSRHIGGLVGKDEAGRITNCYATGSVEAGYDSAYLSGLVGDHSGTIMNCYAATEVRAGMDSRYLGGLVGAGGGVINSYWNVETSGLSISSGGCGKTTAELMDSDTFVGWNSCGEVVWTIEPGQDYPRLAWEGRPGAVMTSYQLSDFLTGSGVEDNPYEIFTAEQFERIGRFPCEWDKCFVLMADVDLSAYSQDSLNIIGRAREPNFAGIFDGNDHVIRNFTHVGGSMHYVGVFGYIGNGGKVKNLGIENVTITGGDASECLGGLAGFNEGDIIDCYATGSITVGADTEDIGGLVGYNYAGVIKKCFAACRVACGSDLDDSGPLGGLVGYNDEGVITNCYATGDVTAGDKSCSLGGLVGDNEYGTITNCHATGTVTGGDDSDSLGGLVGGNEEYVDVGMIADCCASGDVMAGNASESLGGLVGRNNATITGSHAKGAVTGRDFCSRLGGLVGRNNGGNVTCCYAAGDVTAGSNSQEMGGLAGSNRHNGTIRDSYAAGSTGAGNDSRCLGGLVGNNESNGGDDAGIVTNCYSTGEVTAGAGSDAIGGLVGDNTGFVRDSFWDTVTSGQATSDGGTGKTTAKMQTASIFLEAGWDFVDETANGTEDIWSICEGTNYPRFVWQIPVGDFVCPDGISIEDFLFFAEHWRDDSCDLSNDYCDGTDLDQSGTVDAGDLEIFFDNWLAGIAP